MRWLVNSVHMLALLCALSIPVAIFNGTLFSWHPTLMALAFLGFMAEGVVTSILFRSKVALCNPASASMQTYIASLSNHSDSFNRNASHVTAFQCVLESSFARFTAGHMTGCLNIETCPCHAGRSGSGACHTEASGLAGTRLPVPAGWLLRHLPEQGMPLYIYYMRSQPSPSWQHCLWQYPKSKKPTRSFSC